MTILLIIVTIIIGIFLFLINRGKKINPIDSITLRGSMGLRLGDSYEFALSRFHHLNVPIEKKQLDDDSFDLHYEITGEREITLVKDYYAFMHDVCFLFRQDKLVNVTIEINYSEHGLEEMFLILVSRISRVLHLEPKYKSKDFVKWYSEKGQSGVITLWVNDKKLLVMVLPQ